MVAFAFEDYGEKTACKYSTYYEVKYAYERGIPILPLRLYAEGSWPPRPTRVDGTIDLIGSRQNEFVFATDLVYAAFSPELDGAADACTEPLLKRYNDIGQRGTPP